MVRLLAAFVLLVALALPARAATWAGSGNWAGVVDNAHATRVSGEFVVPVVSSACGAGSRAAVWVGLGGYGENTLAQIGFTLTPSGVGAWYEVIDSHGDGYERDINFPVQTGDLVHLGLAFVSGQSVLNLRWSNVSTGKILDLSVQDADAYWSGDTADWVVERQAGHQLAHFGSVHWTNGQYGFLTPDRDLQPSTYRIEMYDGVRTYAATALLTDGSAAVGWKHC